MTSRPELTFNRLTINRLQHLPAPKLITDESMDEIQERYPDVIGIMPAVRSPDGREWPQISDDRDDGPEETLP